MACALTVSGCVSTATPKTPNIALFTSLPIVWPERPDFRGLFSIDAPLHGALGALRRYGTLQPLDTLIETTGARANGRSTMARSRLLVMAQPRPLSPQENVALDNWVRGGGHVLLFADSLPSATTVRATNQ